MEKSHFEFKQFTIFHDKCAMKVGTDGVLLGAWTETASEIKDILDIGTGSGLIAIMLAQKCNADIIGIDLDKDTVFQAQSNAMGSPWKNRLAFLQANALTYTPQKVFDLIVCNPPFFTDSLQGPNPKRNDARHSSALPFEQLIQNAFSWLKPGGLFNVILPTSNADDFVQKGWESGLNLHRKCIIHTQPDIAPKRVLLSLKKGETPYPESELLIIRDSMGDYTTAYKELTKNYYLHF